MTLIIKIMDWENNINPYWQLIWSPICNSLKKLGKQYPVNFIIMDSKIRRVVSLRSKFRKEHEHSAACFNLTRDKYYCV